MADSHLVILKKPYLQMILTGRKRIELRPHKTIEPVRIDKKDWRAWVVLTEGKDFGLLKLGRP